MCYLDPVVVVVVLNLSLPHTLHLGHENAVSSSIPTITPVCVCVCVCVHVYNNMWVKLFVCSKYSKLHTDQKVLRWCQRSGEL